jgi:hypothetical protein
MPETGIRTSKSPPSRCRLNDRFVKTVKPEAQRKLYWDTIQQGLVLGVEPTGHKSYTWATSSDSAPATKH